MRSYWNIIVAGCLAILISCQPMDRSEHNFNLLPLPEHLEVSGKSDIHVSDVQFCFSEDGGELPVRGRLLSWIKPAGSREGAQVFFNVDPSLDLFPENCIYMRWNYRSPQSEGNIKAMEWFTRKGVKVMGATAGQTRWDDDSPHFEL